MRPNPDVQKVLEEVLGYLNFGSGAEDPAFFVRLNQAFDLVEGSSSDDVAPHQHLRSRLEGRLTELAGQQMAFRDTEQAQSVVRLLFDGLLPSYRAHHRDLLHHQTDVALWRPFFLARAFQALLAQGPPWDEAPRTVEGALDQLNDFVGYRPVAVLESRQHTEPYARERVRPIPLYIRGAGTATGRYRDIVTKAMDILSQTQPDVLRQAGFHLDRLSEIAMDPRAYDFGHPVHKRPNYQFGEWDPHAISLQGYFHRFVIRQVALDALLDRPGPPPEIPGEQWLFEAAAVLAGTVLMASAITGDRPEAHASTINLAKLLPEIATLRDSFYDALLQRVGGPHGIRLREEAQRLQQAFGGARQALNRSLAVDRARQIRQYHLVQLYADMGFPESAMELAGKESTLSIRIAGQIDGLIAAGHRAINDNDVQQVAGILDDVADLLRRGVECGALIDPWNIVGFGGNFSLFPALENSIRDHRADDLIDRVASLFQLAARGRTAAVVAGNDDVHDALAAAMHRLAEWWDPYATASASGVRRLVGGELVASATAVSEAIRGWREADAATGDVAFWRSRVNRFASPRSYATVIRSLLDEDDHVAAMALLMHWLSQADLLSLDDEGHPFHESALRWLATWLSRDIEDSAHSWKLVVKFFDYLEANAQDNWNVPDVMLGAGGGTPASGVEPPDDAARGVAETLPGDDGDDQDPEDYLYSAAYDGVVYRDSTADGVDADMLDEAAEPDAFEMEEEVRRLHGRLAFLATVASLWKYAAMAAQNTRQLPESTRDALDVWRARAADNVQQLLELIGRIQRLPVGQSTGSLQMLMEYDKRRTAKELLLERGMTAAVAMRDAARYLLAAAMPPHDDIPRAPEPALLRAVAAGDVDAVRRAWKPFLAAIGQDPLLYVPANRGGNPHRAVRARSNLELIGQLLQWLPRLGLVQETSALLHAVRRIEQAHEVRAGGVTEFDRLFQTAATAVVEALSSAAGPPQPDGHRDPTQVPDTLLVDAVQRWTESHMEAWLAHSRSLRLTSVERFGDEACWNRFVAFVERFGHDLFTQQVLALPSARSILAHGVGNWLAAIEQQSDSEPAVVGAIRLKEVSREEAAAQITSALEAVVEHHAEYREYNSTTTQSDRGELFCAFVDFLRLKARYERMAWNLKPAVFVHRALVTGGRDEAAAEWRQSMAQHTNRVAGELVAAFEQLVHQHAIRLATVETRVGQRFIHGLDVDRCRALVRPAMERQDAGLRQSAFATLQEEIDQLAAETEYAGSDIPPWLEALEEEVATLRASRGSPPPLTAWIPSLWLPWDDVMRQLGE